MKSPTHRRRGLARARESHGAAFTIVELMVGATVAGLVMAGVLTSFLMMARTGVNLQNYTDIEAQSRKALEIFGQEVRIAREVTSADSTSVTLSIPDASVSRDTTAYFVTYRFDGAAGILTRNGPPIGHPAGVVSTSLLLSDVHPIADINPFQYFRYVNPITYPPGHGYADGFTANMANNVAEIKQIEFNARVTRKNITVPTAGSGVVSARFILRNK